MGDTVKLHLDMETNDPDDAMVLAIAATHPRVHLVSVSVTPGGRDQVGLVQHILRLLGKNIIPIGAKELHRTKPSVSGFHQKWLGSWQEADPDGEGCDVIAASVKSHPDLTLLTGAPLSNPGRALERYPELKISRWVGQGGFAGDSVVPEKYRLEAFKGHDFFATFNLNGDVKAAERLLSSDQIVVRYLASKNVCHGVRWDREMQKRAESVQGTEGFRLVRDGMALYLNKNDHDGKKLHDPVALSVAIQPNICSFAEVLVYRRHGLWGSRISPGSRTWISVGIDKLAFESVLFEG